MKKDEIKFNIEKDVILDVEFDKDELNELDELSLEILEILEDKYVYER